MIWNVFTLVFAVGVASTFVWALETLRKVARDLALIKRHLGIAEAEDIKAIHLTEPEKH